MDNGSMPRMDKSTPEIDNYVDLLIEAGLTTSCPYSLESITKTIYHELWVKNNK
jgi:hypothetical protein